MQHVGTIQFHVTTKTTPSSESSKRRNETEGLARQWLSAFASFYNVKLQERGERFKEMWIAALSDLRPEELQAACEAAIRTCRFLPLPAEIRTQLDQVDRRRIASERWLASQPSNEELHRRGVEYCERLKTWNQEIAELQQKSAPKVAAETELRINPDRVRKLKQQARELRAKATPEELRNAERLLSL